MKSGLAAFLALVTIKVNNGGGGGAVGLLPSVDGRH